MSLPLCCIAPEGAELATHLYAAYNAAGENPGLNYRGEPCPEWDALPDNVREKWRAVGAEAVAALLGVDSIPMSEVPADAVVVDEVEIEVAPVVPGPTPSAGRVVQVRLPDHYGRERWRPGIVVNTFGPTCANVRIFLDGANDEDIVFGDHGWIDGAPLRRLSVDDLHGSSLSLGTGVGNWRWPPRT